MSDSIAKRPIEEIQDEQIESPEEGERKRTKIGTESNEIGPSIPITLQQQDPQPNIKSDKRKVTPNILNNLSALPDSKIYERSYMHKESVCNVKFACKTDFLITGSKDGHVKFWKKQASSIEFVKDFLAHQGNIIDMKITSDGMFLCTIGADNAVKIFEIISFDLINMFLLDFAVNTCCWLTKGHGTSAKFLLAVSDKNSPNIYIIEALGDKKQEFQIIENKHMNPVVIMDFVANFDFVISCDQIGMIEYWQWTDAQCYFPKERVKFLYKTDTDLYELFKAKTKPYQICFSPNGLMFSLTASDKKIRVFNTLTGKLKFILDESIDYYKQHQANINEKTEPTKQENYLQDMELRRRIAVEKELERTNEIHDWRAIFDETNTLLIYTCILGIKVVHVGSGTCIKVFGKDEGMRFIDICLYQGIPTKHKTALTLEMTLSDNPSLKPESPDPTLIATSAKSNRFFLFTDREPVSISADEHDRDVYNERPSREEQILALETNLDAKGLRIAKSAILHTSMGDIHLELFADKCPKSVENFTVHSKNGYYNNVIFHRVIDQFMIQTGDPLGDGTGGESIWEEEFGDEFHPTLKHEQPYMLSMANSGPNTNASQFFITVVPCPWLDMKHTMFGRVRKGMDVVVSISKVKVHPKTFKPFDDIKIINVSV
ncbi:peptidylprolyl isomerase domain and WD repeat-containing protein 1 [Oopsacas minuta]|uniref:peptidylprolyl isomerase n=1 Tax=Oopsacas minuta TaxID=111878 RepID=A0AAV7JQ29_9METZ|nr:peptidylprolyl isomerase domain and WD repeat-containing protein 1 [Oopsacas minuta]